MNPICNQKYKTTLCRHWQTSGSCSIGVRCVFAHGQNQLRNPNDPITINQSILADPKMLTSLWTSPISDIAQMNAMVTAQQLDSLKQERQNLRRALTDHTDESFRNTLSTAKDQMNKQHFDITADPAVQKRITTAQMKLMAKQILKLQQHPIIKCKIQICQELLEAQNLQACVEIMDKVIDRPTASQRQKAAYERIIQQAGQLAIQLIAQQKVKYQKMQRDQQMLIKKQQERAMYQEHQDFAK